MSMKNYLWTLILATPLALAGCGAVDSVTSWFDGEDEQAAAAASEDSTQQKYVTLTVKNRYGFRIKDPMGQRITGGSCGIWKDQDQDTKGECCWNNRSECACPCPD